MGHRPCSYKAHSVVEKVDFNNVIPVIGSIQEICKKLSEHSRAKHRSFCLWT